MSGQGDSTLLNIEGTTLMIDTGGSLDDSYDVGKNVLHRYLLNKGINKIDYIMLTHFDLDHCGGAIFLLKNMKVKNLIISKQPEETEAYEEIITLAKEKNTKIIYVEKHDILKIKALQIKIINPDENFITDNPLNNNAIVCKIEYKNFKMLFTGDIEKIAEQKILNDDLKADILKVRTSWIKNFNDTRIFRKSKSKCCTNWSRRE